MLLRPFLPPTALLAELLGGETLRAPEALWLARDAGVADHDFLLAPVKDGRIEVFATALRENYGARFEPLALLPDVLGSPDEPATEAAGAALATLWRLRPAAQATLHAVALPAGVDDGDGWVAATGLDAAAAATRLEALRATLASGAEGDASAEAITTLVSEVGPGAPVFDLLLRNALAHALAARAAAAIADAGLAPGTGLVRAAARLLTAWADNGLVPALPLDDARLGRMAARLIDVLLAGDRRYGR